MTELNIDTIHFSAYKFSKGDWIKIDSDSSLDYGKIRSLEKGSQGQNVYEVETYDADEKNFTEDTLTLSDDSLSEWSGPQDLSGIEAAAESLNFEMDREEIFSSWNSLVNMTEEEMEMWDEHPCADAGVDGGENIRDETLMLMGQAPDGWNEDSYWIANKHLSHIAKAMNGEMPDDAMSGGKGTCPVRWAVNLLNRGANPFDEMPGGNPEFSGDSPKSLDDAEIAFAASAISPQRQEIIQDFSEHGIRQNRDEEGNLVSVDAVYEAMEPGDPEDRNGVRITSEFLQNVADKDYDKPPYLMDHTKDTLSQIGFVKDVWYNDSTDKLMIMSRAYNTGSDTHDEIINRLTFEPPTLTDGSVGFGSNYEAIENDDGETELVDGKLREFSTTPFPAGYDDGGLKTNYNSEDSSEASFFIVAS